MGLQTRLVPASTMFLQCMLSESPFRFQKDPDSLCLNVSWKCLSYVDFLQTKTSFHKLTYLVPNSCFLSNLQLYMQLSFLQQTTQELKKIIHFVLPWCRFLQNLEMLLVRHVECEALISFCMNEIFWETRKNYILNVD